MFWTSRARGCAQCLTREIPVGEARVREYYHRVVVAQWVGVTPPAILDVAGAVASAPGAAGV